MKVTIAGSAAVITSSLTLEDIKTLAKYKPSALTLYGGENGDEPLFTIGLSGKTCGAIGEFGAEFGTQTVEGGKASITMAIGAPVEDPKAYVAECVGGALLNLAKLEESLPGVIEQINTEKAAVLDCITVA